LVENINKYFKIQPKNIIIAGDSAGGNLAVAL
jgi:acetyl esterase/lipase